ncbi:MAG: sugar transferase [Bacteroidia bacterium]|nr:sugar transferase [Bacteroidia bacterium]
MLKRLFDIIASLAGIIILIPFLLIICIFIVAGSGFPVFYLQTRVGKDGKDFNLFKFRTMANNSDKKGLLTIGGRDSRVTKIGYYLRKYKLDELPQLLNVFIGDMSLVGPRPEVRKYVNLYNDMQKKVLHVKPGITDLASIEFFDENEMLGKSLNPEQTYITEVMPKKLELNLLYIEHRGFIMDLKIICNTLLKIVK